MFARLLGFTALLGLATSVPATALTITFLDNPNANVSLNGSQAWLRMSFPGFPSVPQSQPVANPRLTMSVHTSEYAVVFGTSFPSYEARSPLALDIGPIASSGDLFFAISRMLSVSFTIPGFSTVIGPGPFPTGIYTIGANNNVTAPPMGVPQTIHTTAVVTTPIGSYSANVDILLGQVQVSLANATPGGGDPLLRVPVQVIGTGTEFIEGVDPVSGELLRFDNFFAGGKVIGFIETRLAVPEPTTATLLGCVAMGWTIRRRAGVQGQQPS